MCDNTSAISVAKNPVFHKKMRHVERRHYFLRDHVEKGDIEMRYIDIERQLADIFTKPLDSSRFADLRGGGVCHPYGLVWGGVGAFALYIVYFVGELSFFLGIQVKQTKEGIFIHQAKYTKDLMKKFNMAELKPVSTPMSTAAALDPNENGEVVDQREYMSMIGSLLYLKVTRLDIQFIVCLCACF
jgi:hypothetical protein